MENLTYKKLESEHLTLNRMVLTIVFVIIAIGFLTAFISIDQMSLKVFGFLMYLDFSFCFFIYLYIGAAHRRVKYTMNEHGLFIHRGVFWRRKIVVPRNRVQHTDVTQGPLERKFDLAELIVHTAGTRNASVRLPGIYHKDAEVLRESLSFEESDDV